jgi:hypothetical protein
MKKDRVARVLTSCAVDRGFDQRSDQTKNYAIYIGTWHKIIKAETKMHYVQINNMVIDL